MGFLQKLIQGIQMVPALIVGIEGVFGGGSGKTKAQKVSDAFGLMIGAAEAVAAKDILDEKMFKEGIQELISAKVKIFNATRVFGKPS